MDNLIYQLPTSQYKDRVEINNITLFYYFILLVLQTVGQSYL